MASDAGHLPGSLSDLDHHASRKFRLTRQSATELIVAAVLVIGALVLIAATILGILFEQAMRETTTYVARYQMESARTAAANAIEADASNPYAYSAFAGASLVSGDFDAASRAYEAMGGLPRMELPDPALGRAVAVLTDPDSAGTAEARNQARSILSEVSSDPDAHVMLGQLALDEGDVESARGYLQRALQEGEPPSTQGAVVAYNGLGVAMLAEPRTRRSPERIAEAIEQFNAALAYRQPWGPPLVNRDRALALWLRAKLGELENRRHIRAALSEAGEMRGAGLEEYSTHDLRRYAQSTRWPESSSFAGPGHRGEVLVGRIDSRPIEHSRQVTLRPAVHEARLAAVIDRATLDHGNRVLREIGSELSAAEGNWGERWVTQINTVLAELRILELGIQEGGRAGRIRTIGPVLAALLDDLERTPESLQPALLLAYWLVLTEAPESILRHRSVRVTSVIEHLRERRLLERLQESEGPYAVSRRWVRFAQQHLEALERFAERDAGDFSVAELTELSQHASQLVGHLPAESAPSQVRELPLPQAAAGLARLPGKEALRYGEVAPLVCLYEALLREFTPSLRVRANRAPEGSTERRELFTALVTSEQLRARLLGYLESTGGRTLDGSEPRRQINGALNRVREGRRELATD